MADQKDATPGAAAQPIEQLTRGYTARQGRAGAVPSVTGPTEANQSVAYPWGGAPIGRWPRFSWRRPRIRRRDLCPLHCFWATAIRRSQRHRRGREPTAH